MCHMARSVVWPGWHSRCFTWFRVASVALKMYDVVLCGRRGARDVSCAFVWPAWYSIWAMFHALSFGQGPGCVRHVSCGCVVPAWYSRCYMWIRVASVVIEMFHVFSSGFCGTRDVSYGFVWYSRCFMWFRVASVVLEMFLESASQWWVQSSHVKDEYLPIYKVKGKSSLCPFCQSSPETVTHFLGTVRHRKVKLYPNFDEATLPECTRQCGLVLVTHADPRGDFACSLQHM